MSAFKSPVAMATGEVPTAIGEFVASVKLAFPLVSTLSSRTATLLEASLTTARSAARALFALASVLFRKLAVTSATGPRSGPVDGVSVNCCAVRGAVLESVTCARKVKLPGVFGVPVILPVEDAKLNPVGKEPAAILHV